MDKNITSVNQLPPYFVGLVQYAFGNLQAPVSDFTLYWSSRESISAENFLTAWNPQSPAFEKAWFTVDSNGSIYKVNPSGSGESTGLNIGKKYSGLLRKKKAGRIRFRSAPHLVIDLPHKYVWDSN